MRNLFVLTAAAAVLSGAAVAGRLNESPFQTAALDGIAATTSRRSTPISESSILHPARPTSTPSLSQTGELYRTTELTTDGAVPRFSPDGRTLLYETRTGTGKAHPAPSGERIDGAGHGAARVRRGLLARRDENRLLRGVAPRRSSRARRRQSSRDPGGTAPGVRPTFNELVAAAARIVVRQPRTPDANRKCHCPGSARPSSTYGAGGRVVLGKRAAATRPFRSTKRRTDGRAAQRTSGPQDQ